MELELVNVTWTGPEADDRELLEQLPDELQWLLGQQISGFIQFNGGLHVRGACKSPQWHSLRRAWKGKHAIRHAYPVMEADDIPFAQDVLGNQFILRNGNVLRVNGETGVLEPPLPVTVLKGDALQAAPLELPFAGFLLMVQNNPDMLQLDLLEGYLSAGQQLDPGELLHIYPPLCSKERAGGVKLTVSAMGVDERLAFLKKSAAHVASAPDGELASFPLQR